MFIGAWSTTKEVNMPYIKVWTYHDMIHIDLVNGPNVVPIRSVHIDKKEHAKYHIDNLSDVTSFKVGSTITL